MSEKLTKIIGGLAGILASVFLFLAAVAGCIWIFKVILSLLYVV